MKFKKISMLILAASLSLTLLAGCSSKPTNSGNSTKKNVSSSVNISKTKTKIKSNLKQLTSIGVINQTQSNKVLAAFVKSIQNYKTSKKFDPLSSLVKDGTLNHQQEVAVSEALRQFYPKGKETDSGKKELMDEAK